jgi:hypothetical protein
VLGKDIVGVQSHASLLPIRVYFDCEKVIETGSAQRSTSAVATLDTRNDDEDTAGWKDARNAILTSGRPRWSYLHEPFEL